MIPAEKIFPSITMTMNFGASLIYFLKKDVKHGIYWLSAGILTFSVTWL
jgi:hypothetical protein